MPKSDPFEVTFRELKAVLAKHAKRLTVDADEPGKYMLSAGYSPVIDGDVFFGGVSTRKRYVSYYLMPVYIYPGLLSGAPAALKKRMQGKSCFNFRELDKPTLAALDRLTRKGFERFQKEGLIERPRKAAKARA